MNRSSQAVTQKHPMGCAVACVAFRCGIPYDRALALFGVAENAWTRGYYCSEIAVALSNARLDYAYAKFDAIKHRIHLRREGTIIFLAASPQYPAGHYLIRSRKGWMNPWSNFPCILPARSSFEARIVGKISHILWEMKIVDA